MNDNATSAPQHRLHNCGAGPREAFRCPRIGGEIQLDLFKALCRCHEMPQEALDLVIDGISWTDLGLPKDRRSQRQSNPRIQVAGVVAVAAAVLHSLGETPDAPRVESTAEHAVVLLGRVVRIVVAKGWYREAFGLAMHTEVPAETWRTEARIGCERVPLERVALSVAAFGVYTPPMLLWSRQPSLEWMRVDTCLTVRCLWNGAGAV